MRSQKPPHHSARSTINFQVTRLVERYLATSGERTILCISLDAALNVFALSDQMVEGNPRLATNRLKASRNQSTVSARVSSRCIALVEAQVNRHM